MYIRQLPILLSPIHPAGSTGDPTGLQMFIEGRPVTLDFARDDRNKDRYAGPRGMAAGGGSEEVYRGGAAGGIGEGGGPWDRKPTVRSDWICGQVIIAFSL